MGSGVNARAGAPRGRHSGRCSLSPGSALVRHPEGTGRFQLLLALGRPGSLSCLSLLPLLFHIHFLSLSQSFPLFGA